MAHLDLGPGTQCLQHHAVALGQAQQRGQLFVVSVGVEGEDQSDPQKADRHTALNTERAPEVEVPLGLHDPATKVDLQRGGHGPQRDTRTGRQRLEQHVSGAQLTAVTTGRRMKTSLGDGPTGLNPTTHPGAVQLRLGPQRHLGTAGIVTVTLLERGLQVTKRFRVHATIVDWMLCQRSNTLPATSVIADNLPRSRTSLMQESTCLSEVFLTTAAHWTTIWLVDAGERSPETLLEQGVQALTGLLGAGWKISRRQEEQASNRDRGVDAVLEVTPEGPSPYAEFLVDLKSAISPRQAEDVLVPKNTLVRQVSSRTNLMVIAPWIAPRTQQILRDHGINYLDLTGNVHVRVSQPAIIINTQGAAREPRATAPKSSRTTLAGPRAGRLVRLLADVAPPYRPTQLAEHTGLSLPYVSKLLDHLEDQLLIRREGRVISDVDWPSLLRARASTMDLLRHNPYVGMLALNGIAPVLTAMRTREVTGADRVAVTGPYAARAVAPRAAGGQLMLYIPHEPHSPDRIGQELGLFRVDEGADVLLLRAHDKVVFERTRTVDGISHVALSQLVIDGLSGPGRMPAESEAVLEYMTENPQWRAPRFEST